MFAVDLLSESGSRIGSRELLSSWVQIGEQIVIGNWRIVLENLELERPALLIEDNPDLLAGHVDSSLTEITLYPESGPPLSLHSELVFAGTSAACGIYLVDPLAEPVHCVLVRSTASIYLIDLIKRDVGINGNWMNSPAILRDSDIVTIGHSRFECRIAPYYQTLISSLGHASFELEESETIRAPLECSAPVLSDDLISPRSQTELISWLLRILQVTQGELIRRQSDFQMEVLNAIGILKNDQSHALHHYLEKIEDLHREISSLRNETHSSLKSSDVSKQSEPVRPVQSRQPSGKVEPADDGMTAAWLMQRIQEVNSENEAGLRNRRKKT